MCVYVGYQGCNTSSQLLVYSPCAACRDLKESLEQAEQEMRQKKKSSVTENGASDSPGPAKEEGQRGSKVASQRSSLLAMKKAINGDMFTEEKNMFEEKYLVSGSCSVCVVNPLCVCPCLSLRVCVCVCVCVCRVRRVLCWQRVAVRTKLSRTTGMMPRDTTVSAYCT